MNKIICANCANLLSFGPIKLFEEKYYCGRCPKDDGFVVTIFEELAQLSHFLFPCRYNINGCLEKFKFSEMEKHEQICNKRNVPCPIENCTFQVLLCNIGSHLENSHKDKFVNSKFLVDLKNSIVIQRAFKYDNNFLLLNINNKCYNDNKIVKMCLRYLGINFSKLYQKYRATFISMDLIREFSTQIEEIKDCKSMEASISYSVNPHMMEYILQDSKSHEIWCEITFESKTEVKENVLKSMVCPICNDFLQEPIVQCSSGHSFCLKCTKVMKKCCYCHEIFSNNRTTRNYALESISKELVYPCKKAAFGCSFLGLFNELRLHEKTCNLYECPLKTKERCNVGGNLEEVLQHCRSDHVCKLNSPQKVQYNTVNIKPIIQLIDAHDKIFKYYWLYSNDCLNCLVMYVGPTEEASKYIFNLEIINKDETKRLKFSQSVQPLMDEKKIQLENCLTLQKAIHLNDYLHGIYFYCNVSIEIRDNEEKLYENE